ncbi:MAG: SMC-Scp complex subunit ScpB [Nitrospirae bacterium]|nr:SMC-Scp complex subunit ScpB [Nitrospirota bacterium]
MEIHELAQIIESLLFVSQDPLPIDRIKEVTGEKKENILEAIELLKSDIKSQDRALCLAELAGGYQLVTRPENAPWIKKLLTVKTTGKLSRPGLETLAIIAYKQPITMAEVEAIRGVDSGGVIRTLLERRLVKIAGRKEMPGKPILYSTTREFLEYFGLNQLSDLPTLKEFKEDVYPLAEPEFIDTPEEANGVVAEEALSGHSPEVEVVVSEANQD